MINGPNDVTIGGRDDGAAFTHSPAEGVPGKEKPDVSTADTGESGRKLFAGKFQTAEDMEKAYNELQSQFTKDRQGGGQETSKDPAPTVTAGAETPAGDGTIAGARKAVEEATKAGVDFDALNAEYSEKGELSEDTLKDLESKGLSQANVRQFIEGQKALGAQAITRMADAVGGSESLEATLAWAAKNLAESEANAYDNALRTGDFDTAELLMRGIAAKRASSVGTDAMGFDGERSGGVKGIVPFKSMSAMAEAMADPKYKKSEEYRATVMARIAGME